MTDQLSENYDVVVVGGGAAGLNGALVLARSRRSVVVIDAGSPRNAPASGVHGLLARDGMPPSELLSRGRAEVRDYGGHIWDGTVRDVNRDGNGFVVTLTDGRTVGARRILVASGLVDELPDVPGLAERWGRDVIHCPYCHGWEVRDQAIGVLGATARAPHVVTLFRQLSADVTYLSHTNPPSPDEAEQFAARGIRVVDGKVTSLIVEDDRLTGVRLDDDTLVRLDAVVVPTRMIARAKFLASVGLHPEEHPSGSGTYIPADATGRTDVPGIWVAGNVADVHAQVGNAAAAGAAVAAQINADLVADDTQRAVDRHRVAS